MPKKSLAGAISPEGTTETKLVGRFSLASRFVGVVSMLLSVIFGALIEIVIFFGCLCK